MRRLLRRRGIHPGGATPAADPFVDEFQERVDATFTADPASLERVRTRVVAEYRLQAAGLPDRSAARPRWLASRRPAVAFALALGLIAGSFGLVAASSGPGQPFYGLRLAAEELTLPASGPARVKGQLDRLDERLAEARQAATAGDGQAVAAALGAYRDELAGVLGESGSSSIDTSPVLESLSVQAVVLERLRSAVPAAAAKGIDQALDQVSRTSTELRAGHGSSPSPGGPGPFKGTEPHQTPPPGATSPTGSPKPSHSPGRP
jgi:hypothetical protein